MSGLINIPCDVPKAFDFKIKEMPITGYILSMKLKDDALKADWGVKDPENPNNLLDVVAILDHIKWSGKATDPITFIGRMSTENRKVYNAWRAKQEGGSDVLINWVIKEYDDGAKQYYQSFHSEGAEIKFMTTETQPPDMEPKEEAKPEKPKNYKFTLCLSPKSEGGVQMLGYATSVDHKMPVELGIKAGG
ncbi:MAG: hypothetical protein JSR58_02160 [Verrucomicrobia bacterium]|nr:hypothetical protein [Verrucomicrobiota bacterium]